MTRIYLNNVTTKLTSVLDTVGTSCSVTAGDGALFAGATGGNTIRATLVKISGFKEIAWEIIDITARSTDTLTITRALEGTTELDLAIGDVLDVRFTADMPTSKQETSEKDASGGYAGLTLFKLNLRNAANTITNFLTNATTAVRTWTMPDKDGTVAMTSDITGTNSGTNTGDETAARIATVNHGTSAKSALVNADEITGQDSAASFGLIRTTWTDVKAFLRTYFDTLYQAIDAQLSSLVRQNSQSAAYTLVLTDSGKHILHPSADTTARIFTIPANSSVAYPIGTALTFVNQNAGGVVTIAITTDTMRLVGAGTTGSRTLAANGMATALKITSTEWIISGTGLT